MPKAFFASAFTNKVFEVFLPGDNAQRGDNISGVEKD